MIIHVRLAYLVVLCISLPIEWSNNWLGWLLCIFVNSVFALKVIVFFCLLLVVQLVASPADLVKVRMQADGRMVSQGLQPRYSGCFDALNKIVRSEGIGGLWKGVFPNVQRAFLVNMGELACYDQAKHFVIKNRISEDNIYAHTLASIMSGLSATALSCPADVVKTRMMNQSRSKQGKIMYNNSYDCLVKTVKVEGLRALWKGFMPTWARLGPWQFVFWVSYEKFRQIAGFSSFWWIFSSTLSFQIPSDHTRWYSYSFFKLEGCLACLGANICYLHVVIQTSKIRVVI